MQLMKSWAIAICAVAVMVLAGSAARGSMITFATAADAQSSDSQPVKIQATFTTWTDHVKLTLNNLIVNPKSVSQNVSGVLFTLSGGQTSGSISDAPNVELRTIHSDGSYDHTSGASEWGLTNYNSQLYFTAINTGGLSTAWPEHTLIGQPDSSGFYSNGKGSLSDQNNGNGKGNGNGNGNGQSPHNPFVYGPLTVTFYVAGVTGGTTVSDVTFTIGTGQGSSADTVSTQVVPAPGSLALLGVGALLGLRRRRGKRERPGS